tara:strand:+ start:2694 stop:3236 length:543 start_codon:yes stop_codon:yes gene_type:complete
MPLFSDIFSDGGLTQYIQKNIHDPWEDTPFQGYVHMSPKQKGEFGERFVSQMLKINGHTVKKATTGTSGFDRFVDGAKCEIKFSLATRDGKGGINKDKFVMNHVSKDKDWDYLLFVGINKEEEDVRILWFTREDFKVNVSTYFNIQQGGNKIGNDDHMCTDIPGLMKCEWVNTGIEGLKQ